MSDKIDVVISSVFQTTEAYFSLKLEHLWEIWENSICQFLNYRQYSIFSPGSAEFKIFEEKHSAVDDGRQSQKQVLNGNQECSMHLLFISIFSFFFLLSLYRICFIISSSTHRHVSDRKWTWSTALTRPFHLSKIFTCKRGSGVYTICVTSPGTMAQPHPSHFLCGQSLPQVKWDR